MAYVTIVLDINIKKENIPKAVGYREANVLFLVVVRDIEGRRGAGLLFEAGGGGV